MSQTTFFRLLDDPDKGAVLAHSIGRARHGTRTPQEFTVDPAAFEQVPGSPFAYWANAELLALFAALPPFEGGGREARQGLATADDFRFVRLWWEVSPDRVVSAAEVGTQPAYRQQTFQGRPWVPFAKGGRYSPYYADVYLVVNWQNDGEQIRAFVDPGSGRLLSRPQSIEFYYCPGVTWSRRTQAGLSLRAMPAGCIFADKGPAAFAAAQLSALLGLMNSGIFRQLVKLRMAFGSYEVGVIQRTPVPPLDNRDGEEIGCAAMASIAIKRELDTANETSHAFSLPALLQTEGGTIPERVAAWQHRMADADAQFAVNQQEIDVLAQRLYGVTAPEVSQSGSAVEAGGGEDDDAESSEPAQTAPSLVADLLSFGVGCAFGRWDIRLATGARSAPALPNPFDSLPIYSPAMLRSDNSAPRTDYLIHPPAHGLIPVDQDHPHDIARSVQQVLTLILPDADAMENEILGVLGMKTLSHYFSNPREFFDYHTQRYSRSRRKAPIYWLLQSPNRSYGLWLYYHKFGGDTLYKALKLYVEPKIRLEEDRLEAARAEQAGSPPGSRESKAAAKDVEQHEGVLSDLYEFRDRLQRAADLDLQPDLDDGVILNMAPLHELIPWKEPKKYWDELMDGKYEWSSIGKQLRERGLVSAAAVSE